MTDERRHSAGARLRRRALFGPPPRLTRSSPLTGRLLWHIGDWGRASEHIGTRWEEVAGPLAQHEVGSDSHLLVLAATPRLMADVLSSGLPHADALRSWRAHGQLALEPLDFKWSLETASARQVSQETLARLLAAELPSLAVALAEARLALGVDEGAAIAAHDGRFVAPDHPANHAALRAEPGLPSLLLPVDPRAFFEPLPGWPAACTLARWEGVDLPRMRAIETVERYYRLGAGVTGALQRVHTGLFDLEAPRMDVPALLADLRRQGRAQSLNALLLYLEQRLAERKTLEERLTQLPRTAYRFGRLRADLAQAGVPRSVLDSRGALGRAYNEIVRDMVQAIRHAGLDLVAQGMTPESALERLLTEPSRWAALGSAGARALAPRLSSAAPPTGISRTPLQL
ncbi:MAG: hypothetical protein M3336_04995 [Chloroflexota bacterium]|nr:hypothetical protein [Chloroflexota bacterium]